MTKQCILVVEDHQLLLDAIRDLLEDESFDVFTATNGQRALEIMQEVQPDLIVSDIMMPQMDGYTLYQKVRENPEWVRIPFIFLTARGEQNDILKGKELGAEDYITKPFDTRDLIVTIRSRLARAQVIHDATEAEFEALKQQIVNVFSHELRTPLTYISGYTELALDDISTLSADDLQSFLFGIKRGADRLNRLVEELLLTLQIDTGNAAKEFKQFSSIRYDLDKIIMRTVRTYQNMAEANGIQLDLALPDTLPPVKIYEEYFCSSLGRLIDNGIKFSRTSKKPVVVSASKTAEQVAITVADQGIGISEEALKQLFRRFRQIDRQQMEQQGIGMGLYISKSLIEIHGGELSVTSEAGKGSTFTIHLPIASEGPAS